MFLSSYPEGKTFIFLMSGTSTLTDTFRRNLPGSDGLWLPMAGAQLVERIRDEPAQDTPADVKVSPSRAADPNVTKAVI
jgi:hypothetical protein